MNNIFFLGGIFAKSQSAMILKNSSGVIQNAADSFQKNLIDGLDEVSQRGVVVINLPFIGSFPRRFKKINFPAANDFFGHRSRLIGGAFFNFSGIKFFSRFFSAFKLIKGNLQAGDVLIVYSAHLPFILAALFLREAKSYKVCLILPDLPEYMGGSGFFYSALKRVDCFIFYRALKRIDYCVGLTEDMLLKIGFEPGKSLVIEGVASDPFGPHRDVSLKEDVKKNILYTGTLSTRYGVVELVRAFSASDIDADLRVCGEGDGKNEILKIARNDRRIRYLGQLPRAEVLNLQKQATILVNPRTPEGEYTRYSFPSKIMEYMSSGRPVVMHRLPGVPNKYFDYCFTTENSDPVALVQCLRDALNHPASKLCAVGRRAREFVLKEKSAPAQARRILELLKME